MSHLLQESNEKKEVFFLTAYKFYLHFSEILKARQIEYENKKLHEIEKNKIKLIN